MSTVDLLQNIAIITLLFMRFKDKDRLDLVTIVLNILAIEYDKHRKKEGESEDG